MCKNDDNSTNLYDILKVEQDVSFKDLRRSFLRLAKETHPDKSATEENEEFKRIHAAWEVFEELKIE